MNDSAFQPLICGYTTVDLRIGVSGWSHVVSSNYASTGPEVQSVGFDRNAPASRVFKPSSPKCSVMSPKNDAETKNSLARRATPGSSTRST